MPLSDDIRGKVEELLTYEIDLGAFEDWITQETWNVHRHPDADQAAPLAYKIALLLSEFSGGYRDEDELRISLARLFQERWAEFEVLRDEPSSVALAGASTAQEEVLA